MNDAFWDKDGQWNTTGANRDTSTYGKSVAEMLAEAAKQQQQDQSGSQGGNTGKK